MDKYYKIFSRHECPPGHVFQGYIKGTLSSVETHAFEKHLIDCPLCDEVLEGMKMYEAGDFTHDLAALHRRIDEKKENPGIWYAVAATVGILTLGAILVLGLLKVQKQELSMEKAKVSPPAAELSPPPAAAPAEDSELKPETEPRGTDNLYSAPSATFASPEQNKMPMADSRGPLPVVEEVKEADISFSDAEDNVAAISAEPEEIQTDTVHNHLEEVAIVGYGTVKKSDLTGSVSSMKESKVKDIPSKKAEELAPRPYAYIHVLIQSGKLDSASLELEKLLLKNANDEDALWLKADVLIRNNLKDKAVEILQRLVDSRGAYAKNARKRMRDL